MKRLKTAIIGTALISTFALTLSACGSKADSSSKKDSNTITLLSPDHSTDHPKNKDLWMWKQYEKKSGVKVDWKETKDIDEKKNLLLSQSDLPDAFYQVAWTPDEVVKYGKQGLFVPLEKLIPKYAPNLEKLMDDNPIIRKSITAPDGHIYHLPELTMDPQSLGLTFRFYINQKWLDKLGLQKPRTTEDLKKVLTAFVTKDPNGNGKADEQGWYMNSGELPNSFEKLIMAAYGMGTAGRQSLDNNFYIEKDGSVALTYNSDRMRDVFKYEADLYKNGLISKSAFAGADVDKWHADAAKNQVGLWSWVSPEYAGASVQNDYTPINVLAGPEGDKDLVISGPVDHTGLVITKAAANPGKILKWVDYFYGEEGSRFSVLGKEGVTYHNVDGKDVYVDKILNYEKGAQLGAYQYLDNVYGGGSPYMHPDQTVYDTAQGLTTAKYDDFNDSVMPKYLYSPVMPTPEESEELSTIMTDMNNFVEQSRVKFVTGKWNFTSDWDNYKAQLKKIGADKLLKIRQAQYKRFSK